MFPLVLLLCLDWIIFRFLQSEAFFPTFFSHTNLISCVPSLSPSESLIPVAFFICLLTSFTSCEYYCSTLAFKNWALQGSLGTTEDGVECQGRDAEGSCRTRLAQSVRNAVWASVCVPDRRGGCTEWFIWEICHDHTENKTTSAHILVGFVVKRNAFYFLLGGLWSLWIGTRFQLNALWAGAHHRHCCSCRRRTWWAESLQGMTWEWGGMWKFSLLWFCVKRELQQHKHRISNA